MTTTSTMYPSTAVTADRGGGLDDDGGNDNGTSRRRMVKQQQKKKKKKMMKQTKRFVRRIFQIVNTSLIVMCGYQLYQRTTITRRAVMEHANIDQVLIGANSINTPTWKMIPNPSTQENQNQSQNQNQHHQQQQQQTAVGKVYTCGWKSPTTQMFPDYEYVMQPWDPKRVPYSTTTYHDLLVIGMYKACPITNPFQIIRQFRGKVLLIQAEPKFWTLDTAVMKKKKNRPSNSSSRARSKLFQMGAFETDRLQQHYNQALSEAVVVESTTPALPSSTKADNASAPIVTAEEADDVAFVKSTPSTSLSSLSKPWQDNTLQVHYLTLFLLEHVYGTERWEWIIDPTKRRRNSGRYSAVAYFTSNCVPFRQEAAMVLSGILPIHYGEGGCEIVPSDSNSSNNDNHSSNVHVVSGTPRSDYTQNHNLFHEYKYCLVMENTFMDGYITEKILNAYLGGCLPIYYGTVQIYDIFHPDSFIYYDIANPQPAVDLIRHLEAYPDEYNRRLTSVPILKHGQATVNRYFSLFPEIGDGSLNGKIREMMELPSIDPNVL